MRVLLDTNIIIHREANRVIQPEIGKLFNWFDRLRYEKCIHPSSIEEIRKYQDKVTVTAIEAKIKNYNELKTIAPMSPQMNAISAKYDNNDNDKIDTALLNEVFSGRVDILITEDKKVHKKAADLGIANKIFTIEAFLEKAVAENPELVDYKVLAVKKRYFGELNINDQFFDSFKEDYMGFDKWFNKKSDEIAYVCQENNDILAFLYIKAEGKDEPYSDIEPPLPPKKRLKIGTFKVISNGFKLGERFLKIVFDNAMSFQVDEIYVTIFDRTNEQKRLIWLLEQWGFVLHGKKRTQTGDELVYVRDFSPKFDTKNPNLTYPYFSRKTRKFVVPIYAEYHTELFPDSILNTESPMDFSESEPNRNAVSKVYVSRSINRNLNAGDVIVFYRTKPKNDEGKAHFRSVTTTIGIVQQMIDNIKSLDEFIELCKKRSVFTNAQLKEQWEYNPRSRPFVVNFLYVMSFPKRLILSELKELNIIKEAPRGFEPISDKAFQTLLEKSNADQRLIVD